MGSEMCIRDRGKVINKMLFALRDSVNEKAFLECVAGLEKTYEK